MLAAAGLWSCSSIIDINADCDEVAHCNGYACNEDNTACLAECRDQNDCRAGFLCDRSSGVCESSGCTPATPVIALDGMRGPYRETDVTWVDDSGISRGQIIVTATSTQGIGIARFHADTGDRIADVADEDLNLLRYDNAASGFYLPSSVSVSEPTRVVTAWRRKDGDEIVRTAAVLPVEQNIEPTKRAANVGAAFTAEQLQLAAVPQGFLAAWTGEAGQQRQIEGVLLNDDRSPRSGQDNSRDAITIFSDRQTASSTALADDARRQRIHPLPPINPRRLVDSQHNDLVRTAAALTTLK